eukprot:NODE_1213_length_1209_cov_265.722704.p1 GENE.NODE_1213_length_1209_cov_265.722704~~NODE_1213_length_1209_cov_265.722704.p1  ORF type:complete len:310 (+),score=122.44 NODE_1213_length_1209_cov_265.722704:176-1105(+)
MLRGLAVLQDWPQLEKCWKMVRFLMASWKTILSMLSIVILFLYVFACIGFTLIQPLKDSGIKDWDDNFGNILKVMLTLVQFVTVDGIADIYKPLIRAEPSLVLYFFPMMIILSISLMNIVTAMLVEGSVSLARMDREKKRRDALRTIRELIPEFQAFFRQVDVDGSGTIQAIEMEHLNPHRIPEAVKKHLDLEAMVDYHSVLNTYGSGDVTETEFVHGLLNLCMSGDGGEATERAQVLRLLRTNGSKQEELSEALSLMRSELVRLSRDFSVAAAAAADGAGSAEIGDNLSLSLSLVRDDSLAPPLDPCL